LLIVNDLSRAVERLNAADADVEINWREAHHRSANVGQKSTPQLAEIAGWL